MGEPCLRIADAYEAGLELAGAGRHAEAIAAFETALAERPDDTKILFALGNTAKRMGLSQTAEQFFRMVLASQPDRLEALVNLANLLREGGHTTSVIDLLKPALERDPGRTELWLTLGSALREAGDVSTAKTFYAEALRLDPGNALALGNTADLLADEGRIDEGLALYEHVIAVEPENTQARLNRSVLLLNQGQFERGWHDYEYRLSVPGRRIEADHGLAQWDGVPREGLKLLVTAEQGVGDQIMFVSMIPDLMRAGLKVTLEAEPRLVPWFARSFPKISVRAAHIETRGTTHYAHYEGVDADTAIAMGSLGKYLRKRIADFPSPHAYLKPDSNECARWRNWLREQGAGPFIGLCWRSGKVSGLRAQAYAPFGRWAEFAKQRGGTLVSLQYDAQPDEIAELERLSGKKILVPPGIDQKNEFDRMSGLIAALDGVVSAPTAVAWQAAALGVTTCKILFLSSWTSFGQDFEPFAPSCRAFRPAKPGDWADAFAKAEAAL